MIIQCEQCKTKFRLDDSKISDKGVKVRCAKCRHIFTVEKEQPESVPQADFSSLLEKKLDNESLVNSAEAEGTESDNPAVKAETETFNSESNDPFGSSDTTTASAGETGPDEAASVSDDSFAGFNLESNDPFGSSDTTTASAAETGPDEAASVSDDSFAGFNFESDDPFGSSDTITASAVETKPEEAASVSDDSFAGFNFESNDPFGSSDTATASAGETRPEEAASVSDDSFAGFSFESKDPFSDTSVEENLANSAAEDNSSFSGFGDDSSNPFADRQGEAAPDDQVSSDNSLSEPAAGNDFNFDFADMPGEGAPAAISDNGNQEKTAAAGTLEEKQDDFFDFNDLKAPGSFSHEVSDESPVKPPSEASPVSFAKTSQPGAEVKPVSEEDKVSSAVTTQEDLPPLSISSRRKQNSLVSAAIAVIGVLVASLAAFYGYSYFAQDKGKSADTEKIIIRSVDAAFVNNPSVGEMLVVTGEAQNNFKKPRAAIQIKVMVYGSDGQIVASKSAYAGNQLSKEQLATLPMEKIEAAMANQFGDSLSNLGVLPEKTIPFLIVIPTPPANAKDYGVEPAGSTVATGK